MKKQHALRSSLPSAVCAAGLVLSSFSIAEATPQLSISEDPIRPETVIRLQFETPMIPETTGELKAARSPVMVEPPLAGAFLWENPRAGRFVITEAPRPGAAYTFSLRKNLADLAGSEIGVIEPVEVRAEPFAIRRQTPSWFNHYNPSRTPQVIFEFSGPVDVEKARKKIHFVDDLWRRVSADVLHPEGGDYPENAEPLRTWGENDAAGALAFPRKNALVVSPLAPLPVGKNWKLVVEEGLASLVDGGAVAGSRSVRIGTIEDLTVAGCYAVSDYDMPRSVDIHFNKDLNKGLSEEDLPGWVDVFPVPEGMKMTLERRRIRIDGEFVDGVKYRVGVKGGFPAQDATALAHTKSFEKVFKPQGPYLALPAYEATRLVSGGADFEVLGANLKAIKVRAKLVEPHNQLYAMRAYELYLSSRAAEDDRPVSIVPFDMITGTTIYSKTFEIDAPLDRSKRLALPWRDFLAKDATGTVFIDIEGVPRDEVKSGRERLVAQSLIQVTDVGLALKSGPEESMIFAFSQETGQPLAGIDLTVFNREKAVLQQVFTDADGLAQVATAEDAHWVVAEKGEDRFAVRFGPDAGGLSLWQYGIAVDTSRDAGLSRRTLLFTDRPLYRPGETLHMKALTRIVDGDAMRFPAENTANLKMIGPRGRTLLDRMVTFSATGSLDDDIVLPEQNVGSYRLELDFSDAPEGNSNYWERNVHHAFRVDEYAPNTFEVALKGEPADEESGDVPVSLHANYLMGKPLSKANYAWTATVGPAWFSPAEFQDYYFGWWSRDGSEDRDKQHTYHGRGELGPDGNAVIALSAPASESSPGAKRVYVNAEVTDINQQTITKRTFVDVPGSDFYLGVRRVGPVRQGGAPVRIEAVAVTPDGKTFAGEAAVECLVERREYNSVRMKTASGGMVTRNEPVWIPVVRAEAVLSGAGNAGEGVLLASFTPETAGDYAVILKSKDARGRLVETRMGLQVHGSGKRSFAQRDGIRIDLEADKEEYAPGDTAIVTVKSPIAGTALITVERNRVQRHYRREIGDAGTVVEIPIEEGDGPNVFLSVMVVRGAADCPRKHPEPEFKLGFCELRIDDKRNHLQVEVAPVQPAFQPGENVVIEGSIRDAKGNPVAEAEVTLYAVDEGVLSLTGYHTPDPFPLFNAPFPLAVKSAVTLTSLLSENPEERSFVNKGRLIGGGGEDESGLQTMTREDFRACAYWDAGLRTDANGKVRVEFEAPDSLTRYRIVAVASAGADRFGSSESAFEINKPLMIEPALARFGNAGDRLQAKGVVYNTSAQGGKFKVTLTLDTTSAFDDARGIEEANARKPAPVRSRTLTLAAGETGAVVFPVRFVEPGSAAWTWDVRPAGDAAVADSALHDRRVSRFEVGHPMPLLKESHYARLQPGQRWDDVLAAVDANLRKGSGVVTVSLSRNRMMEAGDALDYILRYPYGCVEQTTSSLLPWLRMRGMRTELPNLKKTDDEILAAIQGGANRLMTMITASGGLAYWPGGSEPMLWGSAYGGLGLTLARQQGADVPDWALDPLYKYLSDALRQASKEREQERMIDLCLGAYTLAVAGRAEHSYHELLFGERGRLCREARCLLAMAILEADGDRGMARALMTDPVADMKEWVYWHGTQYQRSLELMTWSMLDAGGHEADERATALLKMRNEAGHWGSTHTSGWAVLALAEYTEKLPKGEGALACDLEWGDFRGKLTPEEGRGDATVTLKLSEANRAAPLKLGVGGRSPVVVNVRIESRPADVPAEPVDHGFSIARTYREIHQDGRLTAADDLVIGDLVMVEIDVESKGPARYMVIDDALPCLFEAINPNFGSQQVANRSHPQWDYWYCDHKETRTDRVVFFRNWLPRGGKYKLQYLARVIAEGEALAPATKIEEMYDPGNFGLSSPERFVIPARKEPAKAPAAVAMDGGFLPGDK